MQSVDAGMLAQEYLQQSGQERERARARAEKNERERESKREKDRETERESMREADGKRQTGGAALKTTHGGHTLLWWPVVGSGVIIAAYCQYSVRVAWCGWCVVCGVVWCVVCGVWCVVRGVCVPPIHL